MSAWYRVGTITSAGNVVTGTGTKWADNKMGIGAGQMLIVPGDGIIQMYEILFIDSDTRLRLVNAPEDPLSGAYAIISFYTDSVPDFARRLAAQLSYYQSQMDGWQQIMTGTGNVTIIAPDGTEVTIASLSDMVSTDEMNEAMGEKANKGANNDITELNGLTKAITISQGGSGSKTAEGARTALSATTIAPQGDGVITQPWHALFNSRLNFGLKVYGDSPAITHWDAPASYTEVVYFPSSLNNSGCAISYSYGATNGYWINSRNSSVTTVNDQWKGWAELITSKNTTVDPNGFIKKASPIIKLFGDGTSETNLESVSAMSERISEGIYKISGVLGFNSDKSWGGPDGGIEIPLDKNKQALIWIDYKVNADGDLLIKTYHRTHPSSPVFARNIIDGYEDGQPIDIPAGRFVDLRVQMPEVEGDDMSTENVN